MKVSLKNGATKIEIEQTEKIIFKQGNHGGFNAKKYNGIIPLKGDALTVQKN